MNGKVTLDARMRRTAFSLLTGLLKYCVSLVFLLLCPLSPVCLVRSTKQTEEEGQ